MIVKPYYVILYINSQRILIRKVIIFFQRILSRSIGPLFRPHFVLKMSPSPFSLGADLDMIDIIPHLTYYSQTKCKESIFSRSICTF